MQLTSRATIANQARTWVGVPFQHRGRSKAGVDCAGLVMGVAQELALCPVPVTGLYGRTPPGDYVLQLCERFLVRVERRPPGLALGDVALLWGIDRGVGRHFAIMGEVHGQQTMIHAFSKHGKVVEHYWDSFWRGRFVAAYEYPNVEPL